MHILVVIAHPNPKSFNHAILDTVLEEAGEKGHECTVRNLYAEGFQPVLSGEDFEAFDRGKTPADIKDEQDAVKKCDVLVVINPIWWFGMPAILKGWIDRVFVYGFAYGHDSRGVKPMLTGRKAIIVNTAGGQETEGYDKTGFKDAIVNLNDAGIFKFVGFDVILHRMFFEVQTASDAERRDMLELLRLDLRKIL